MESSRNIIHDSVLEDSELHGLAIKYAAAPKSLRQMLIRENPDSDDARICAAIEVQRVARGYSTRCRLLNTVHPKWSKTAVYGASKHDLGRLDDVATPPPPTAGLEPRQRLEYYYDVYKTKMEALGEEPVEFQSYTAHYIQNWWGRIRERRATIARQRAKKVQEKKKPAIPKSNSEAAVIIQRAWRRHIDIQVYHYYRDLINFRNRGDPMMMLRCINPNEAKMLDAAAGIHIKYRLAGDRFPPNIYYKIFTHRPIQDLCANSPKDYTKHDAKRQLARDVHNKGDRVPDPNREGWYRRSENNGWRLVSDRLLQHIMSDPVTWESSTRKIQFHHNRLKRKTDVEKKKKQKKIEWMKKMYREGMLKAKVDDKETVKLIEGAAAGMVATIERHGQEAVQDWEVDELLEWTTSLNFEDYCNGWKEIATSANSEQPVVERLNLMASFDDPYEIALAPGNNRGSTRQSHNTPVSSQSVASFT